MELQFYKAPFHKLKYGSLVYDSQVNFVFQFESKFTDRGEYVPGTRELQKQVLDSLNSKEHRPIKSLSLSMHSATEIYNNGEEFITIRGWGNLTRSGANAFSAEKAAKIQDDFAEWILYKLTKIDRS